MALLQETTRLVCVGLQTLNDTNTSYARDLFSYKLFDLQVESYNVLPTCYIPLFVLLLLLFEH